MATKTETTETSNVPFNLGRKHLHALGRRKTATARVRLYKGEGRVYINEVELTKYIPRKELQRVVLDPLELSSLEKNFDISILVRGGGVHSQLEAARLGISRCLVQFDEKLKPSLKKAGFLKRDPRKKERKKPGLKKARKSAQFSKR